MKRNREQDEEFPNWMKMRVMIVSVGRNREVRRVSYGPRKAWLLCF